MTRLELLEKVNQLNMHARAGGRYWTCTVLYSTVIWRGSCDGTEARIVEVIKGVPK